MPPLPSRPAEPGQRLGEVRRSADRPARDSSWLWGGQGRGPQTRCQCLERLPGMWRAKASMPVPHTVPVGRIPQPAPQEAPTSGAGPLHLLLIIRKGSFFTLCWNAQGVPAPCTPVTLCPSPGPPHSAPAFHSRPSHHRPTGARVSLEKDNVAASLACSRPRQLPSPTSAKAGAIRPSHLSSFASRHSPPPLTAVHFVLHTFSGVLLPPLPSQLSCILWAWL